MKIRLRYVIVLGVVGCAALGVGSDPLAQAPLPEVERFGPQIGERVPDFSLVDQFGEMRDLESLMGPNGLMLVFSRSADW